MPPPSVTGNKGMLIYPTEKAVIPAKSQIALPTCIQLAIPKGHVAAISRINSPSPCETLVCPKILDPAYSEKLVLLVRNLTDLLLVVVPKVPVAYVHFFLNDNIAGYRARSLMRDLGLPKPAIHVKIPPLMPTFSLLITLRP